METAAVVPTARAYPFTRWAPLGGVLYVVLFVIGVIFMFSGAPSGKHKTPATVTAWYMNSTHRAHVMIGWLLCSLGVFFLLWFVAALRRSVSAFDAEGLLAQLTGMGGAIYAALAWAALALNAGIRTMNDDTYHHQAFYGLIHGAEDASWLIHATGAGGLAVMIIAASLAFLRARVWPKWAGWLSVAVGILTLASLVFFPQLLFLAWILIVSLVLFFRPPGVPRAA
jgi:hypothetical protein